VRTPPSGFIEPCLPSTAERPPSGPDWIHEIKHDGYRLMARRDPVSIRLLTRHGHDWTTRFPLIVEAGSMGEMVRGDRSSRGVNLAFAAPFLSCSRSLCSHCQRFAITSCLFSTTHGNAAM
jgi:hypothetical protein